MQALKRLLADVGKRCRGGKLPDTYVVFDTETSGGDPHSSFVLQYGMTFVRDRKRVGSFSHIVKRPPSVRLEPAAVAVHGITRERMEREGLEPAQIVPMVLDALEKWRSEGALLVGHNAMAFDLPLLSRDAESVNRPFRLGEDELVDTGMLVKAAQIESLYFRHDDTLPSFYARVNRFRAKGIYWSLDRYCIRAFGLERYGIKPDEAHDAGKDCDAAHHLFEELRRRGERS